MGVWVSVTLDSAPILPTPRYLADPEVRFRLPHTARDPPLPRIFGEHSAVTLAKKMSVSNIARSVYSLNYKIETT